MEPIIAMTLIGLIIFIGYAAVLLFKRTRIPDLIILIFLGVLLGPGLNLLNSEALSGFSSYIASLALIIIMFEGGLSMRLSEVIEKSPRAMILATASFTLTCLLVGAFCHYILGWELLTGLLLGAIVGGSSSLVIIPLIQSMRVPQDQGIVLELESALTDGFCIVVAFTLLQIIVFGVGAGPLDVAKGVASKFSVGMMAGLITGLVWLKVMTYIKGHEYDYMLSFAALFVLYGISETLGGSGAMAILMFGIVLGNSGAMGQIFRMKEVSSFDKRMREFHSQITFFIRTFFFVYLGMLVSFQSFSTILEGIGVLVFVLLARVAAVQFFSNSMDKSLILYMMGRGLAAAVLSTLPLSYGIEHAQRFPEFVFIVILGTVLITTYGVIRYERKIDRLEEENDGKRGASHEGFRKGNRIPSVQHI